MSAPHGVNPPPWLRPRNSTYRACDSVRRSPRPHAGGVSGSYSPARTSVGTSLVIGVFSMAAAGATFQARHSSGEAAISLTPPSPIDGDSCASIRAGFSKGISSAHHTEYRSPQVKDEGPWLSLTSGVRSAYWPDAASLMMRGNRGIVCGLCSAP